MIFTIKQVIKEIQNGNIRNYKKLDMCQVQLLNHNELGCVMNCSVSNEIHLGFGMVIYILTHGEFENLSKCISNLYDENYGEMMLTGKKIFLKTDSKKIILALNIDELKLMCMLINEALIMLEVNNVLKVLN